MSSQMNKATAQPPSSRRKRANADDEDVIRAADVSSDEDINSGRETGIADDSTKEVVAQPTSSPPTSGRLKMTVLPNQRLEDLKAAVEKAEENNRILRTHNIDLARQNANLRNEHNAVNELRTKITKHEALDTNTGELRTMQDVLGENYALKHRIAVVEGHCKTLLEKQGRWENDKLLYKTALDQNKQTQGHLTARVAAETEANKKAEETGVWLMGERERFQTELNAEKSRKGSAYPQL